jgi:eukaryotic-like serine/threonine-protein kinase
MAEETGQRVGDYEVVALLGSGGMGRVYKVRSVISNREEAMKILLPDFASEQELAARFMAEIRTLAGLDHPNITQLRTAFQVQNQFVMVMEFVEGTSLDKLHSQLALEQAIDYATQVLAALSYAHGKGVTHRDIKPANIMITTHGVVKLMDFGIAKSTTDLNLTRPGTTMGSIYYMSPEQVRGGIVDGRSDIYSFGVTLYEMVTGRKPFQAETSYSVLNAQLNEAPAPPAQWNPSLSRELNDIVLRAMAKDPGARFQSADEFRAALKALREGHPASAPGVAAPAAAAAVLGAVAAPIPAFASSGAQFAASGAQATPPFQSTGPTPASGFAPVPVAVAPPPAKSHRGLWIGLGALAAVLALVAAAAVLPRFFSTHAGGKSPQVASNSASTGAGGASSAAQPNGSVTPAPSPSPGQALPAGVELPQADVAPSNPTIHAHTAAPPGPKQAAVPPKQIDVTRVDKKVDQPVPVLPPVQPAPPSGPSPEEIHHARDRFMDIDARADAVTGQFESMRREQQSHGYDMRGDMVGALNRMNNDIREADRAINERDLDAARDYMDKANEELHKLEQFLGR